MRKLHLCVDETSKEIVAVDLTTSGVHDSPHLPAVLDQVEGDIGQVFFSFVVGHLSFTCCVPVIIGRICRLILIFGNQGA